MSKVDEFINSLKVASNIAEKSNSVNITGTNSVNTTSQGTQTPSIVNNNLKDYEVLSCIANSINPYTD